MHKVLLMLVMVIGVGLLRGMDSTSDFAKASSDRSLCSGHPEFIEGRRTGKEIELAPITLSQVYYHFSHDLGLLPEIAQHILSLQYGDVTFEKIKRNSRDPQKFVWCLEELIPACGNMLANEVCKCFFAHEKISVCDIQNKYKSTSLHVCTNPKVVQILLRVAGNDAFKLLTMQRRGGWTALHDAAFGKDTEIVKLLLSAAGTNVYKLLMMQDDTGRTALHSAAERDYIEGIELLLNAAGTKTQDLIMIQNENGDIASDQSWVQLKTKQCIQKYMTNNAGIKDAPNNGDTTCCIQ